jgi:hypothetical protein
MNYHTLGHLIEVVYNAFLPHYGDELASVITALLVDRMDEESEWC